MKYEKPELTSIGTLHDMTLGFNKVGGNPDVYSAVITNIVGSITHNV